MWNSNLNWMLEIFSKELVVIYGCGMRGVMLHLPTHDKFLIWRHLSRRRRTPLSKRKAPSRSGLHAEGTSLGTDVCPLWEKLFLGFAVEYWEQWLRSGWTEGTEKILKGWGGVEEWEGVVFLFSIRRYVSLRSLMTALYLFLMERLQKERLRSSSSKEAFFPS